MPPFDKQRPDDNNRKLMCPCYLASIFYICIIFYSYSIGTDKNNMKKMWTVLLNTIRKKSTRVENVKTV